MYYVSLLDDRTIGCNDDEPRDTRACSGDENAFAGPTPRTRHLVRLGDGDGSDGCARRCNANDGSQRTNARDGNRSNTCHEVPGIDCLLSPMEAVAAISNVETS
jgi:hypothetical protein